MQADFPEDKIQVYLISISEIKLNMELSEVVKMSGDKLINIILKDLDHD